MYFHISLSVALVIHGSGFLICLSNFAACAAPPRRTKFQHGRVGVSICTAGYVVRILPSRLHVRRQCYVGIGLVFPPPLLQLDALFHPSHINHIQKQGLSCSTQFIFLSLFCWSSCGICHIQKRGVAVVVPHPFRRSIHIPNIYYRYFSLHPSMCDVCILNFANFGA